MGACNSRVNNVIENKKEDNIKLKMPDFDETTFIWDLNIQEKLFKHIWIPRLFFKKYHTNDVWFLFDHQVCPRIFQFPFDDFEEFYQKYQQANLCVGVKSQSWAYKLWQNSILEKINFPLANNQVELYCIKTLEEKNE